MSQEREVQKLLGHTPGPWRITATHLGNSAKRGEKCIVGDVPAPTKAHPGRIKEETVHCEGHGYDEYCFLPNDADRILIAAAPELLAALRNLLDQDIESVRRGGSLAHAKLVIREEAAAAIAKATGSSPASSARP